MAVDEGLTQLIDANPILRVYSWQPFTISIGYHQDAKEIDSAKCRRDGVGFVRRPTGGRAIFHAHEVTYSVIIPNGHRLFAKISVDVYNEISSALVLGLQMAGLPVSLEKRSQPDAEFSIYHRQFACFASSARYEIQYQSRKLVGSAQRRFANAMLQHGSILIGQHHLKLVEYLAGNENGNLQAARENLQKKTICIEEILNRKVRYDEIAACMKGAFEKHFAIAFEPVTLTNEKLEFINQRKTVYTDLRRRL